MSTTQLTPARRSVARRWTLLPPSGSSFVALATTATAISAGAGLAFVGPAVLAASVVAVGGVLSVRWPVPLYGLYLYLGVFKIEPEAQGLPIDLTALVFFLLVAVCAARALSGRGRRVPPGFLLALLALGAWMAISLAWGPGTAYASEKVLYFITLSVLAAIAPFFLVETRRDVELLLATIVALSLIAALVAVASESSEINRLESDDRTSRHVSTGRLICASALTLLLVPMQRRYRVGAIALAAVFVVLALGFGSRGALVALAIAAAYAAVVLYRAQPKVLISLTATAAAVIAVLSAADLSPLALERVSSAVADPVGTVATDTRGSFYETALEIVDEHPFIGVGAGGFSTFSYQLADPAAVYPHNIVLELAAELGLPAALLFMLVCVVGVVRLTRAGLGAGEPRESSLLLVAGALLVFHIVAAQLSFDINGNRPLWGFLGLAFYLSRHRLPPNRRITA